MDKITKFIKANSKIATAIAVVVVIGVIYYIYKREKFSSSLKQYKVKPMIDGFDADGKPFIGDTTYFQNINPDAEVETRYHNIMGMSTEEGGCSGNYFNRLCSQKAYIKALENGTNSIPDMICNGRYDNEDDYYACLGKVYGNYYPWSDPATY